MLNRATPKYLYKGRKKREGREGGGRDSWLRAPVSLVTLPAICQDLHRLHLDRVSREDSSCKQQRQSRDGSFTKL